MKEIQDKVALLFNHLEHEDDEVGSAMAEEILLMIQQKNKCTCSKCTGLPDFENWYESYGIYYK